MQVLKIQPQTFKSSYIKLIALLWSIICSLILVIILETKISINEVDFFLVFGIIGVAYMITALGYILIRNARKDYKCLKVVWLVDIAYFIAGILYYVGRNVQLPVAQPILLGMVVVLYRFIPFFISKYYQSNLAKEHQTTEAKLQLVPEWILAAESLTLLVEFDALYIITINSFSPFPCCTSSAMTGSWVQSALFVLMYMLILFYTMNIQYSKCNVNISCAASNLGAIVLLVAFYLHLLDSNVILQKCLQIRLNIFGVTTLLGIQIAMKLFVLIVVITVIVLLLVYCCLSKARQEKLLPRALYQHLHPEPDEPYEPTDNNDYYSG